MQPTALRYLIDAPKLPVKRRKDTIRDPHRPSKRSENEKDHHEDDGDDESENGDHAGVHAGLRAVRESPATVPIWPTF